MKKYLRLCIVLMMAALVGFGVGFVISFYGGTRQDELASADLAVAAMLADAALSVDSTDNPQDDDDYNNDEMADAAPRTTYPPRIADDTRMVYDYYNAETGDYERVEEYAAQALLGLTATELAAKFVDWQIVSFDSARVYLRQNREIEYRRFIIGVHEGYIAVFYDNDDDLRGIKELTSRPIAALPEEEQQRLIEGIKVVGNEELMRALEDFSS